MEQQNANQSSINTTAQDSIDALEALLDIKHRKTSTNASISTLHQSPASVSSNVTVSSSPVSQPLSRTTSSPAGSTTISHPSFSQRSTYDVNNALRQISTPPPNNGPRSLLLQSFRTASQISNSQCTSHQHPPQPSETIHRPASFLLPSSNLVSEHFQKQQETVSGAKVSITMPNQWPSIPIPTAVTAKGTNGSNAVAPQLTGTPSQPPTTETNPHIATHALTHTESQTTTPKPPLKNGNDTASPSPAPLLHSEAAIRSSEVEAALRSKPQRGRKRENLSVMERLELTRTRNREHAKSTRVRKKARYEELLIVEKNHQQCIELESLRQKRCISLVDLIQLRCDTTRLKDDDAFQNSIACVKQFEFVDFSLFSSDKTATKSGVESMLQHDRSIRQTIALHHGSEVDSTFRYVVTDPNDGVAVHSDIGYARYDAVISSPTTKQDEIVASGVVYVRFAPNLSKIRRMESWIAPYGLLSLEKNDKTRLPSVHTMLGGQSSYPSVVSLDITPNDSVDSSNPSFLPDKKVSSSKDENHEDAHGPGMNIEECHSLQKKS